LWRKENLRTYSKYFDKREAVEELGYRCETLDVRYETIDVRYETILEMVNRSSNA
jgi:chaperonin cofactor prefoldin